MKNHLLAKKSLKVKIQFQHLDKKILKGLEG